MARNDDSPSRPGGLTALGKQLLTGDGVSADPQRGAALIAAAAQEGDGEAAALAAVLIGMGARTLADWTKALEYLQQSAEAGWQLAQQQLATLGDAGVAEAARSLDSPPDLWGRLRRSIDVAGWFQAPAARRISDAPLIELRDGFLPPRICAWLMERARGGLERSRVFAPSGEVATDRSRTNSAFEFNLLTTDVVLLLTRARIAKATGFLPQALEHTNILHYAIGQAFEPHYDFLDPELPAYAHEIATHGQRVATFLVYLNDDYAGGETEFSLLKRQVRPAAGSALYFHNVDSAAVPDRRTLHAGRPVAKGEKWLLSQWIRGRVSRA